MFDPKNHPHRRYNPLLDEYILVSPHRMKRPWQGQTERTPGEDRPHYDPECYLCPGNVRTSGALNPDYTSVFVFTNDFAALLPDVPHHPADQHPLMQFQGVKGTSRVICFSPRHDLTLARMALPDIRAVIDVWADQTTELGRTYQWVQVFENRGEIMGSSNPHPHGQIWAQDALPNLPYREEVNQRRYYQQHQSPMLLDYVTLELEQAERIIVQNESWVILVPYWATWPFETLLLPKKHLLRLPDADDQQRDDLADILRQLLIRYDNLFEISFAYSMGLHGAPFNEDDQGHWMFHIHFYPPLLRSATVRKFMVGYEMMGESQRDLTAEQAAERLRSVSAVHYKDRSAS